MKWGSYFLDTQYKAKMFIKHFLIFKDDLIDKHMNIKDMLSLNCINFDFLYKALFLLQEDTYGRTNGQCGP